jgi:dipeptidyl aminopeptidase/acylaminoacyl peptidase
MSPTEIQLSNENGRIAAYLTPASDASGTLVCVHGGPNGDFRGNEAIFDQITSYAPSAGFNVLQFDMFGAGASDGQAAEITLESQLRDYRAAFFYAEAELERPVHVVGESMGATIAALDWNLPVETYVLLWPAFDLRNTDLEPYLAPKWMGEAKKVGHIDDDGMVLGHTFLEELSTFDFDPCFQLPNRHCLLVHGKQDAAVPFEQSIRAVREAKGECVLFAHPEGDHGLQRPNERRFTHEAIRWWLGRRSP